MERRTGDHLRHLPLRTPDGFDYLFELFNRNKRGIALDVERPAGREIFHALLRWCDVYITNHLPRVQRRLGDRPEDIFAINRRVVYARGSGQGQRGPDAERGGNDNVAFWSRGGVGYMLSDPGSEVIIPQRAAIGDAPSGVALAAGILAGILHVARTGEGIEVNASLFNAGLWTLGPDIALASATGVEPQRQPSAAGRLAGPLTRHYRSRDGRRLALSMTNEDRYWPLACRALGLNDLVEIYADGAARQRDQDALLARFRTVIAAMDSAGLDQRLRAEDCVYAFINNPVEVLEDSAVIANGYLLAHPTHPTLRRAARPRRLQRRDRAIAGGLAQRHHRRTVHTRLRRGLHRGDLPGQHPLPQIVLSALLSRTASLGAAGTWIVVLPIGPDHRPRCGLNSSGPCRAKSAATQRDAELPLQARHLVADLRRRQAQPLRRAPEMQLIGQRHEDPERLQIHHSPTARHGLQRTAPADVEHLAHPNASPSDDTRHGVDPACRGTP